MQSAETENITDLIFDSNVGVVDKLLLLQDTMFEEPMGEDFQNFIYQHLAKIKNYDLKIENFGADLDWLNTARPLSFYEDLDDHIVVLDFFTYCCINCMHVIPYLQKLEELFPVSSGLVVVGVHSAKFPHEKNLSNLKEAILRNHIDHPVVNDEQNIIWNQFSVSCWPTLVILGPKRQALFALVGEKYMEKLFFLCENVLHYFKTNEIHLNVRPLPLSPLKLSVPHYALNYPGKICTNNTENIIIVSNTGSHNLIVIDKSGYVKFVIGKGCPGFSDGCYDEAMFNSPQGVSYHDSEKIYVADTGNHAIRLVDLKLKKVSTLIKTCENYTNENVTDEFNLLSPWDVCLGPGSGSSTNQNEVLYIASAGSHRILMYFLESCKDYTGKLYEKGSCTVFAGNGKEENRNNLYPKCAGFAQPSGIALQKEAPCSLYIADSESSSIRSVSLVNGHVKSVVGGSINPLNLFEFGDKDGIGTNAKLQHPLGISVCDPYTAYIADSYNNKIKKINLKTKECVTYCGSGKPGHKIGKCLLETEFNEPGGIYVNGNGQYIFVTDTNNHCIKVIDVKESEVYELTVFHPFLEENVSKKHAKKYLSALTPDIIEQSPSVHLACGGEIKCVFHYKCGNSLSLNTEAYQTWKVFIKGFDYMNIIEKSYDFKDGDFQPFIIIKDKKEENSIATLLIITTLNFCNKDNATCFPRTIEFHIPLKISNKGSKQHEIMLFSQINK